MNPELRHFIDDIPFHRAAMRKAVGLLPPDDAWPDRRSEIPETRSQNQNLAEYNSRTESRIRTTIVNTPSTVPSGMCRQLMPATTSENVRPFRARRHRPEIRFNTPQIKPFEDGKQLLRRHRHGLLLVLKKFGIGKHRVHECVMHQQEQKPQHRQAGADEMEDGEQVQMIRINLALVAG